MRCTMHIGDPVRTIIVEPLELPVNVPTPPPENLPETQDPEPEEVPASA